MLRKFDSFATRLHPIDFCYLQPQLVPAVNCLAEKVNNPQIEKIQKQCDFQLFWPGIDLGEGLLFPDFSCVALYKRLCVGFGLVVPDCRLVSLSARVFSDAFFHCYAQFCLFQVERVLPLPPGSAPSLEGQWPGHLHALPPDSNQPGEGPHPACLRIQPSPTALSKVWIQGDYRS